MNDKELNEEEIQNYKLKNLNNEVMIFYQDKKNFSIHIIILELF
jgi:hypothetical protein